MDPVEAWSKGVNVQAAYNNPQTQAAVEAALIAMAVSYTHLTLPTILLV